MTLIHNDLRPQNLFYSHNACRILDWKNWRPGLAAEDLAYLIAYYWPAAKRRFEEPRFLKRYADELIRCGQPWIYLCPIAARLPYGSRFAAGRAHRLLAA